MTPLFLTVAMTLGADEKAAMPNIEGKWLIVYAEEGSRRNTTWEQKIATAKDKTLSYSKEGEKRVLRMTVCSASDVEGVSHRWRQAVERSKIVERRLHPWPRLHVLVAESGGCDNKNRSRQSRSGEVERGLYPDLAPAAIAFETADL